MYFLGSIRIIELFECHGVELQNIERTGEHASRTAQTYSKSNYVLREYTDCRCFLPTIISLWDHVASKACRITSTGGVSRLLSNDVPEPQDYNEAIQSPALSFRDSELQAGSVRVGSLGIPMPSTGAFASVYRLRGKERDVAVRCFHRQIPDLETRYKNLQSTFNETRPDWMVDFEFQREGIKVRGKWHPIVKMEWIEGEPLDRFLDRSVTDSKALRRIAKQLKAIHLEMRAAGISHGDLQHGNILVTSKGIKLLDYDGMFVPSLDGTVSAELGHPNYQHPFRTLHHFGSYTDNFTSWLLQLSLICLLADPTLFEWSRDRERILFGRSDLAEPSESALVSALLSHDREEVRRSARLVVKLASASLESIPDLNASEDDLLALDSLELTEKLRLMDEIYYKESAGPLGPPPILEALSALSARKDGAGVKISKLIKKATIFGEGLIGTVRENATSPETFIGNADQAYLLGNFEEASQLYLKAFDRLSKLLDRRGDALSQSRELFEHCTLRLGYCNLRTGNSATAVFYFKTLLSKNSSLTEEVRLETIIALFVCYCHSSRFEDADAVIESRKIQEISVLLLSLADREQHALPGMLSSVTHLARRLREMGDLDAASRFFEISLSLCGNATSMKRCSLLLELGHCQLIGRHPDMAAKALHQITSLRKSGNEEISDELFSRALIALAVALKMVDAGKEVSTALRAGRPESLFHWMTFEMEGPLGDLEEFAQVVCAFTNELGEAGMGQGVRKATRLAANSYKKLDESRRIEEITILLDRGNFQGAHALVDEEILEREDLRKKFANEALSYARTLALENDFDAAFEILTLYRCPKDVVTELMEGRIIHAITSMARHGHWNSKTFDEANKLLRSLLVRRLASFDLLNLLQGIVCDSSCRSENFVDDLRQLADSIESATPEGSSHPVALKVRQFALSLESTDFKESSEQRKFVEGARRTGSPSRKTSMSRSGLSASLGEKKTNTFLRKLENDALMSLTSAADSGWRQDKMIVFREKLIGMSQKGYLHPDYCDRVSRTISDHLSLDGRFNRWQKEQKTMTRSSKRGLVENLNSLMDLFAAVRKIDSNTLRRLQKCIVDLQD